jgi:hypothetical protein
MSLRYPEGAEILRPLYRFHSSADRLLFPAALG